VDYLRGLKENVIMGRLIPAGTGLEHYRSIQLLTEMPAPAPMEEIPEAAELTAEEAAALDFLQRTPKRTLPPKAKAPFWTVLKAGQKNQIRRRSGSAGAPLLFVRNW